MSCCILILLISCTESVCRSDGGTIWRWRRVGWLIWTGALPIYELFFMSKNYRCSSGDSPRVENSILSGVVPVSLVVFSHLKLIVPRFHDLVWWWWGERWWHKACSGSHDNFYANVLRLMLYLWWQVTWCTCSHLVSWGVHANFSDGIILIMFNLGEWFVPVEHCAENSQPADCNCPEWNCAIGGSDTLASSTCGERTISPRQCADIHGSNL